MKQCKKSLVIFIFSLVLILGSNDMLKAQNAEELINNKENTALDRWKTGDTFGFIEIAAEDITYFDPGLEKRVSGKKEFHDHLASFNGTFSFPRYEFRNTQVQLYDDIGILTFNFVGFSDKGKENKWNATEVFRLIDNDWKIVSSHWSKTKPE